MGQCTSMIMTPALLAIVGHSGCGKTTLIEKLLPLLNKAGLRVATIKHTHHDVVLDAPGKDSWRHKQAGAAISMLLTPSGMQLVTDANEHSLAQLAQRYFFDMDLVLAEGFSHAACAKIEVLRAACSTDARCTEQDGLIAMVTDVRGNNSGSNMQLPHFVPDDISGIAQWIVDWQRQHGSGHD
jgi:molybdopterin-guanine dinucleotide biosynthesis protein B